MKMSLAQAGLLYLSGICKVFQLFRLESIGLAEVLIGLGGVNG